MGYVKAIEVVCPDCGETRNVRGFKHDYADGKRACRSCSRKRISIRGTKQMNTNGYTPWDHDPWKVIKAECIVANQLHDGWTGNPWF